MWFQLRSVTADEEEKRDAEKDYIDAFPSQEYSTDSSEAEQDGKYAWLLQLSLHLPQMLLLSLSLHLSLKMMAQPWNC